MLKNENNKGGGVYPAFKCKSRAERLVYHFGNNDKDRQGSLSRKKK